MASTLPTGHESFEGIRRYNGHGQECWSSRQLAGVLGYTDLRNFEQVLAKAKQACVNSGQSVAQHFEDVLESVEAGKGAQRPVKTTLLSRYACYLVIQNADPQKPMVALGQTYFAVQTRKQELSELGHGEDEMRLHLRGELKTHNTLLAEAARAAGVQTPKDYAIFQNHGYQGLYGAWATRRSIGVKA
jgi:DNA-damage-inducible protein D